MYALCLLQDLSYSKIQNKWHFTQLIPLNTLFKLLNLENKWANISLVIEIQE